MTDATQLNQYIHSQTFRPLSLAMFSFFQCIATAASDVGAHLSLLVLSETSTKGNNMVIPYMDDSFNLKAVFGLISQSDNVNAYNKQI